MTEAEAFTKAVSNSMGGNRVNSCFPILLNELNEETEESGGHYDNPNAMPFFPPFPEVFTWLPHCIANDTH